MLRLIDSEKGRHVLAGALEGVGGLLGQPMGAPVDVRAARPQEAAVGLDDRIGHEGVAALSR